MTTIKTAEEINEELTFYKKFMLENEYTTRTTEEYAKYLSWFLNYVSDDTIPLQNQIYIYLEDYSNSNFRCYKMLRAALYLYFKSITGNPIPKYQTEKPNPIIENIVEGFYDFSVNVKHIRESSAKSEARMVREFLEYISEEELLQTEDINAYDIRDFVVERLSHLVESSKGRTVTAIRNFFRFQEFQGISIHKSVFQLPLSPAVWKNTTLRDTIDNDILSHLHEIPNENTPTGKRDCCIVLFFTELALRCIEVANLALDDFDWYNGLVSIRNTKTRSDRKLPIPERLYKAIIEYLRIRPQTSIRTLFIRFKHHCGEPMGREQIRGVIRRVYAKCDVEIKSTGTHILRRTVGTKLYNSGNSLKMTADILGHESLNSTTYYTRVDMNGLCQVTSSWPKAGVNYDK